MAFGISDPNMESLGARDYEAVALVGAKQRVCPPHMHTCR